VRVAATANCEPMHPRRAWQAWGEYLNLRELFGLLRKNREVVVAMCLAVLSAISAVRDWWMEWPLETKVPSIVLLVFLAASITARAADATSRYITARRQGPKMNVRYGMMYYYETEAKIEVDDKGTLEPLRRVIVDRLNITNQDKHDFTLFFTLRIPLDISISKLSSMRFLDLDLSDSLQLLSRGGKAFSEPLQIPKEGATHIGLLEFVMSPVDWLLACQGKAFEWDKAELLIHDTFSERTRSEPVGTRFVE
jgi:hypothetical protein